MNTYVKVGLVALAALIFVAEVEAQSVKERFKLFAACKPMGVYVDLWEQGDVKKFGIQEDKIRAALESRLRAAHLYQADALNVLAIEILVSSKGIAVADIEYHKMLYDPASEDVGLASTWGWSISDHSSAIYSFIAETVDKFLAEYLRVNEVACQQRK